MPTTVKNLIPPKQAESTNSSQYTALNVKAIVDKFTATNTSTVNVTFSINVVNSGGSASASNLVLDARTIAPNETYLCPEVIGQVLQANSFISTIASISSSITIRASGREIS